MDKEQIYWGTMDSLYNGTKEAIEFAKKLLEEARATQDEEFINTIEELWTIL